MWTAILLAALCATALAWAAAVLHERGLRPLRRVAAALRRPTWGSAFLAAVAVGFIHHGATKGTNGMDMGGAPVVGCGLSVTSAQLGVDGSLPTRDLEPSTLNSQPSTNLDWLAFGGYEDWFRIPLGDWCFRFGSNLTERLAVFVFGEVRTSPHDVSNRISVLGLPLSIVPAANWHLLPDGRESLFRYGETPSSSLLLTWKNALVNRDTNMPVTVQAELFPDGAAAIQYDFSGIADTSILSNAAVRIWRDGAVDEVPLQAGAVAEVAFPAPPVPGTNTLAEVYARIAGGDTNAYCFAEVVVPKGPTKLRVEPVADGGDGSGSPALPGGTLGAYAFMAEPGETNRLPFLIGPRYAVSSEVAFSHFAFVPSGMQTPESHPLATNLTDRLMSVQWPVTFGLDEVSVSPAATVYALRVTPDFLRGTVSWNGAATNEPMRGGHPLRSGGGCSCGCQSFSSNTVSHASSCTCSDCSASGGYGYEGHVEHFDIPFPGDGGGEPPGPGGGEDPPPDPPQPSVSVSFEKPVVIFEDSYEDSPGVFVPRRSTTTKLTVTAYGGENGGTLSLSVVGGLDRCSGQSGLPGYVPPGQTIEWEANYEGIAASSSQGGAVATVTFTDSETGLDTSGAANATVVEIKLHPKIAVGNRPYRHAIGVCEAIDCLHEPSSFPIDWESTGDGIIIEENGETVFVAPVKGNSAQIVARKGNVMLPSDMTIAEPEGLLCSNVVTVIISAVPQGATGGVGMNLHLYVLPLTVSFANIAVEEVPCLTGTHFGYFTNSIFSGRWSHTYDMGAGRWRNVGSGNYYGPDASTSGDWPSPWSWGLMTWDIPIGWTYANPDEGDPQEKNFPVQYLSTWTLEADGTISKSKHGHTVSRTTNDIIRLDGVIINGN